MIKAGEVADARLPPNRSEKPADDDRAVRPHANTDHVVAIRLWRERLIHGAGDTVYPGNGMMWLSRGPDAGKRSNDDHLRRLCADGCLQCHAKHSLIPTTDDRIETVI